MLGHVVSIAGTSEKVAHDQVCARLPARLHVGLWPRACRAHPVRPTTRALTAPVCPSSRTMVCTRAQVCSSPLDRRYSHSNHVLFKTTVGGPDSTVKRARGSEVRLRADRARESARHPRWVPWVRGATTYRRGRRSRHSSRAGVCARSRAHPRPPRPPCARRCSRACPGLGARTTTAPDARELHPAHGPGPGLRLRRSRAHLGS